MPSKVHQQIAILDFGSQYTHLISRRIRDFSILSRIYPATINATTLSREKLIGIILSGGPMSVYDKTAIEYDPKVFDLPLPILGLCYGHQLIGQHFGGKVKPGQIREYGFASLKLKSITPLSKLFQKLPQQLTVWMSHGDTVVKLPPRFQVLASTRDCPIAAMGDTKRHIYGLQFHPEVHHTKDKDKILFNFVVNICAATKDWQTKDLLKEMTNDIKKQAKNKKVFLLVSGGVDSTVAFALLEKALGKKNVIGLHINSGLMRQNESAEVKCDLAKAGFADLKVAKAESEFFKRLKNISDPEDKRKIIGETYLDIAEKWFKKYAKRSQKTYLLGQGTIYPDTIESGGTEHADIIKTHHNRIARIQKMIKQGKVIEPLKNLYKDEVRKIGCQLGLPNHLLKRHPFPGPGLGIMVLCSQKNIRIPQLKLPRQSQILPIKSTGVQGDQRTYAYPLAVWGREDWDRLEHFSTKITNRFREINRVVKICWLRQKGALGQPFWPNPNMYVTPERLKLLRQVHQTTRQIIKHARLYHQIWEFPIILLPIGLRPGGQSIVLRPACSKEVMTINFYRLPQPILKKIINSVSRLKEIDAIFYDLTNKPPATMQWE